MDEKLENNNVLKQDDELLTNTKNNELKNQETQNLEIVNNSVTSKKQKHKIMKEKHNGWVRLGTTLSVMSFLVFLYSLFASLSILFVAVYYIVIVFIVILTFFTVLFNQEFKKYLNGGEKVTQIAEALSSTVMYSTSISIAFATLGITLLLTQKKAKHKTPGLVLGILSLIGSLLLLILKIFAPVEIV